MQPRIEPSAPVLDAAMVRRLRAAVPEAVRNLPGWLLWREEPSDDPDKPRKVPYYSTDGARRHGDQNVAEELPKLVTFEEAVRNAQALAKAGQHFHGLGFAPRPEFELTLLDFDNKQGDPRRARLHDALAALAPGAYREISPSGKGSHVILRGNGLDNAKHHAIGVEVFASKGYVTMTGEAGPGAALVELPEELRTQLRWAPAVEALLPHWSEKRHFLALALSGAMLNAGHGLDDVLAFVRLVAVAAGDKEIDDRLRGVRDTAAAKLKGEAVTGLPALADLLGEQTAVDKIKRALKLAAPLHGLHSGGAGPSQPSSGTEEIAMREMTSIEAEPVDWLWPNRIARGKLFLLAGNPGVSKSVLSLEIAAIVSGRNTPWPIDGGRCEPGHVLLWSCEDDPADTIKPRLMAAEAVLERVHLIEGVRTAEGKVRPINLTDVDKLDRLLSREPGKFSLLVIDPIGAYLAGRDSHKYGDIVELLAPFGVLAHKHRIAIILVTHLNKATGASAAHRIIGSVAFNTSVRGTYLVVADPADKQQLLFLPSKGSVQKLEMLGLSYRLRNVELGGGIAGPRVEWEGIEARSADQLLNPQASDHGTPEREEAEEWLRERLADGPVAAKALRKEVSDAALGFGWRTVEGAKQRLGVLSIKQADGWHWKLPEPQDRNTASPCESGGPAAFGAALGSEGKAAANTAPLSTHTALRSCGLDDADGGDSPPDVATDPAWRPPLGPAAVVPEQYRHWVPKK